LTVEQIQSEYDEELTSEARQLLLNDLRPATRDNRHIYVHAPGGDGYNKIPRGISHGLLGGLEVHPLREMTDISYNYDANLIPVYECE
jgi:hypothetical protein